MKRSLYFILPAAAISGALLLGSCGDTNSSSTGDSGGSSPEAGAVAENAETVSLKVSGMT